MPFRDLTDVTQVSEDTDKVKYDEDEDDDEDDEDEDNLEVDNATCTR